MTALFTGDTCEQITTTKAPSQTTTEPTSGSVTVMITSMTLQTTSQATHTSQTTSHSEQTTSQTMMSQAPEQTTSQATHTFQTTSQTTVDSGLVGTMESTVGSTTSQAGMCHSPYHTHIPRGIHTWSCHRLLHAPHVRIVVGTVHS